jgi:hypothetical protein
VWLTISAVFDEDSALLFEHLFIVVDLMIHQVLDEVDSFEELLLELYLGLKLALCDPVVHIV